MSTRKIKFRTTAVMETDLEYFFEMTQTEVDAAVEKYGSLEEYVKQNVDGGEFSEVDCIFGGGWRWGEVNEDEDEDEE